MQPAPPYYDLAHSIYVVTFAECSFQTALLFGENAIRITMGLLLCFPNRFYFYIEGANILINIKQIERGHVDGQGWVHCL